jgi:mRNA interferase MazF
VNYVPDRGDLVWIHFDPQSGNEQMGRRPGLVLSPRRYNDRAGLAIICPVTSKIKGYPFEVELPAALQVTGVVLADQARSLDWRTRKATLISAAPALVLEDVLSKLEALLSLS